MEFSELIQRALAVRQRYAAFEQRRYGNVWSNEELALGFVGDVGDLAKLVMAYNGRRTISDVQNKLAHELADCLWSVIVLAHVHGVDLETAFLQTMSELQERLEQDST